MSVSSRRRRLLCLLLPPPTPPPLTKKNITSLLLLPPCPEKLSVKQAWCCHVGWVGRSLDPPFLLCHETRASRFGKSRRRRRVAAFIGFNAKLCGFSSSLPLVWQQLPIHTWAPGQSPYMFSKKKSKFQDSPAF